MQKIFKRSYSVALLALILSILIASCNKENNSVKQECSKEDASKYSIFSSYLGDNSSLINHISLTNKGLVLATEDWDFSMSGTYSSSLNANTSKNAKLNYIDVAYEDVDADKILSHFEATKENFKDKFTNLKNLGLNKSSYDGDKIGWLNYTGSPEHLVVPVTNRTILLITPNKLYKLKMISMYECAILKPTLADNKKVPYLTCNFEEITTDGLIDL